jgi:uncharacterized membrane protein YvbJ
MAFCANCGTALTDGAGSCGNCGRPTGVATQAASSGQQIPIIGAIAPNQVK